MTNNPHPLTHVAYLLIDHAGRNIGRAVKVAFSKDDVSELLDEVMNQNAADSLFTRMGGIKHLTVWQIKDKAIAQLPFRELADKIKDYTFSNDSQDVVDVDFETLVSELKLEPKEKLLVQLPQPTPHSLSEKRLREEESALTLEQLQERSAKRHCAASTPSYVANDPFLMTLQQTNAVVLNGRPWTNSGPPVGLHHPIFDRFNDHLNEDASPSDQTDFSPSVLRFMQACSQYFPYEPDRRKAVLPLLSEILRDSSVFLLNADDTRPDAAFIAKTKTNAVAYIALLGLKWEDGNRGDVKTQVQQSYARTLSQPEQQRLRQSCCSPCFLIALSGSHLSVFGAVYTQHVVVEPLFGHIDLTPRINSTKKTTDTICRLFSALRMGLKDLTEYYSNLSTSKDESRFFPHVHSYCDNSSNEIFFEYVKPMSSYPSKVVYEAKNKRDEKIVVKFAHSYNAQAHHLLTSQGLAPKLLYDGTKGTRYGGLLMVVMSYVEGQTLSELLLESPSLPSYPTIHKSIKKAITILHKENLVYGDLRTPNIMIDDKDEVKLVDFDWCGVHGEDRYPFIIGTGVPWATGVDSEQLMRKEHDLHMLEQLEGNVQSGVKLGAW